MDLAYVYIRYSTAEQAGGDSKDRQERLAHAYAEKHKLKLSSDVFFDSGVSGYTGKNRDSGELGRFIKLVDSGEIKRGSYLLVESLDRLTRLKPIDGLELLHSLMRKGIVVVQLVPEMVHRDGDSADLGATLSAIMEVFRAHGESSRKGGLLASAFAKKRLKARDGLPMGDTGPGWLSAPKGSTEFRKDMQRVQAVERIFQLAIDGYGKGSIAKMLNAEGYPILSKRTNVKGWGVSAVHHVLKSRAVLGEYQPMTRTVDPGKKRTKSGDVILNYYPPIISEETFALATRAVERRRVDQVTRTGKSVNVWGKVGKCMLCGAQLHVENRGQSRARPTQGAKYLGCSMKIKGLCKAKSVRLDASEQVFVMMLGRLPILELVKDSGARLADQLEDLEAKLHVAQKSYGDKKAVFEVLPSVDVAQSMEATRQAVEDLKARVMTVTGDLAAEDAIDFKTFKARLDLVSDEGRRKANDVLKRLKVLVYYHRDRFVVTMDGEVARFGLGLEGKQAGYFDIDDSPFGFQRKPDDALHIAARKATKEYGRFLYFILPEEAGPLAFMKELDLSENWEANREGEGQLVEEGWPPGAEGRELEPEDEAMSKPARGTRASRKRAASGR